VAAATTSRATTDRNGASPGSQVQGAATCVPESTTTRTGKAVQSTTARTVEASVQDATWKPSNTYWKTNAGTSTEGTTAGEVISRRTATHADRMGIVQRDTWQS